MGTYDNERPDNYPDQREHENDYANYPRNEDGYRDPHHYGHGGHVPHRGGSGCHDYPPPLCQQDFPRDNCYSYIDKNYYREVEARHGRVINPPSRAQFLVNEGLLAAWEANEMEGGKNFPATTGGTPPPPFQTDAWGAAPPPDGFIISGGRTGNRNRVNFTDAELNQLAPRFAGWPRLRVAPGQRFNVEWFYQQAHVTRGYRWFITRDGWNPNQRITREQLESRPFYEDISPLVPFNNFRDQLIPRVFHSAPIPLNKRGHHIIVMVWVTADSPNGFYQGFDVDIG
ncbi:lytic polysaccharide monooxygenase auxiliary activity family 9 protein [Sodalis sp. RH24]|uniref:lytic polysaccharide monooxygenase auxiliary activity family 9 protein n=1 Tax=unclassified Sodalis (in: enterobacteria) TaxID=2636512 RepID=UPI0039B5DF56